jgi:hypothetical protein
MKNVAGVGACLRLLLVLFAATPVLLVHAADIPVLPGQIYDSEFPQGHATFNGMGVAHDGTIYYVITSEEYNIAGQMYSFNPKSRKITHLGDLSAACGEDKIKAVAQGKSHVTFVEDNGKLYFSTHLGYYNSINGVEKAGAPPAGYLPYQGGHLLAYDMKTGKFDDLATAPRHEGIITMSMDVQRGRMYGITWPTGHFLRYDLKTKELKDLGTIFREGEIGSGPTYRTICRSIVVDPRDGSAYFTSGEGVIYRYRCDKDAIESVTGADLKKDYFGVFDPASPGSMAYNWRKAFWSPADKAIFGVHGASGYLFRFDPRAPSVELLDRITSEPSKSRGMKDKFGYGYLSFALGPDGHTVYYLTGAPISSEAKDKSSKREEDFHLVTYDIPGKKVQDHGRIVLDNGDHLRDINAIAVGLDGTVYTLSTIRQSPKNRTDLVSFHP